MWPQVLGGFVHFMTFQPVDSERPGRPACCSITRPNIEQFGSCFLLSRLQVSYRSLVDFLQVVAGLLLVSYRSLVDFLQVTCKSLAGRLQVSYKQLQSQAIYRRINSPKLHHPRSWPIAAFAGISSVILQTKTLGRGHPEVHWKHIPTAM